MFKRPNSNVQREMRSTEAAPYTSSFDMFLELSHDVEQRLGQIAREYPVIRSECSTSCNSSLLKHHTQSL
jgi:hypothetical protein